jgi:hypothetical protein
MHCFDAGGEGRSNCSDRRHLFARKLSTCLQLALSYAYDSTLAASKHQENGKKRTEIWFSIRLPVIVSILSVMAQDDVRFLQYKLYVP